MDVYVFKIYTNASIFKEAMKNVTKNMKRGFDNILQSPALWG
jgi:hypothetical protein